MKGRQVKAARPRLGLPRPSTQQPPMQARSGAAAPALTRQVSLSAPNQARPLHTSSPCASRNPSAIAAHAHVYMDIQTALHLPHMYTRTPPQAVIAPELHLAPATPRPPWRRRQWTPRFPPVLLLRGAALRCALGRARAVDAYYRSLRTQAFAYSGLTAPLHQGIRGIRQTLLARRHPFRHLLTP